MGEAKGHKFGQCLGEYCQAALAPLLEEFAAKNGLYLDRQGQRAARKGKKVKWLDGYGNSHDLDFVLERGGSAEKVGVPVAFIESAWRRYTKHSRNKAQEIQGAVMPVRDKHYFAAPFMGCFLVGEYTAGARGQLSSLGFHLLHFDYQTIVEAFSTVRIDASFDETTSDQEFDAKQRKWDRLSKQRKERVWQRLLELNAAGVKQFMTALEASVRRSISEVRILPFHGNAFSCNSVADAIAFVAQYAETAACAPLVKYEVQIRYSNGDKVDAQFNEKAIAIDFLEHYRAVNWTPIEAEDDRANEELVE